MSSTLSWYPKCTGGTVLSTGLKFKLRNLYQQEPLDTVLSTETAKQVLRALAVGMGEIDPMIEEIHGLIAGIEKHGEICLKEEW